jgi:predicted ATPase/DNA-binding winged helix-turn-helix (wHTH) protein
MGEVTVHRPGRQHLGGRRFFHLKHAFGSPMPAAAVANSVYLFGRFAVEPKARRLLVDGKLARLSDRAFDLLVALIACRERMVDKNELLDMVWPGTVVEESNIYVHVSALRKLLGSSVITTVPGRGYRFAGKLEGLPEAPAPQMLAPFLPPGVRHDRRGAGAPAIEPERRMLGNLPAALPALYGRSDHLPTVLALLQNHRLITLVGAGGIGKTRMALAAASIEQERWPDGVWLVELARTIDPAGIRGVVAQALGIGEPGPGQVIDELAVALRSRRMLLVLDNAEHLLAAVAAFAANLLAQAPRIKLLVTSREPLHLPQEQQFRVPPLAVPLDAQAADPREFGALALFEARAAAVDPRFNLNTRNAPAIADICRRLDGLPLAIELAAARVTLLGIDALGAQLRDGFRVLAAGAVAADSRHQTLRATFDWAHALLDDQEQTLLRRLGVFVGGFTLELAQQVAADESPGPKLPWERGGPVLDEWAILDLLGALIDKSLVVTDFGERPRYRLLETTRAYALDKLEQAREQSVLAERHARAICRLFCQTEAAKNGDGGTLSTAGLLQLLLPELDNLRRARDWAMGATGNRQLAIALSAASAEALRLLGHSQEAARVMLALQDQVDERTDPASAALFWNELAFLGKHGRLPRGTMITAAERAEQIYRRLGAPRRIFRSLLGRGHALMTVGRLTEAEQVEEQMARLESAQWPGRARCLRLLLRSMLLDHQERYEEALDVLAQMRVLLENEPGEDESLLLTMCNMCGAMLGLERYESALALAREVMQRSHSPRITVYAQKAATSALTHLDRAEEAAALLRRGICGWQRDKQLLQFLGLLALLAYRLGRVADSARLDGANQAFQTRSGLSALPMQRRAQNELHRAYVDAALADAQLQCWRQEGAQLSEEMLVRLCLGEGVCAWPALGKEAR